MADAEAMGRLVSLSLRLARSASNADPKTVAQKISAQLRGIGGASHVGFGKDPVMSLADAIAKALAEDLAITAENSEDKAETVPLNLTVETESASGTKENAGRDDVVTAQVPLIADSAQKTADLCPECGQASFVFEEGCKKCYSCGYSMC
jgi:ribonucleoside-diphosphate reductase alpha chain